MSTPRTFHEAKARLASGSVTVQALAQAALARAKEHAELNIFLELFEESALAKAAEVDAKLAAGTAGPLAGAIISIKDNLCYAGHRVSASSKMLEGYESPFTATAVQRLLDADAVIMGRTNCDEFAMGSSNENSAYGPVSNPLDPARVPGGSSGGAAASLAAGICHIAIGSDTGGSIRQPASFCGVAGFKPTYGRISRYGLIAFASSFDQIGPFAHDAADVEAAYRVMAGTDPLDNTSSQRPVEETPTKTSSLRIGYYRQCVEHAGMDPEIKAHFEAQVGRLKSEGHVVEAIDLPMADLFVPTYYILSTAEASSNLARFDGIRYGHRSKTAKGVDETYRLSRTEGFGPEVKRRILLGTFVLSVGHYDAYYAQAMRVRRLVRHNTVQALKSYDLVMTPTCPTTAFPKGHISDPVAMYLQDIFTVQANLAGIPAISIPTGTHSNGMPFGTQMMAKPYADLQLLDMAKRCFS
ncbi:MAG: Asp-tRNA(Asn)/Glu-tRNA(Gln) amidotransferase subunit GatA [Flavobacteriales bacterium]|jgi:aspartyl-tRNA(Asn)/glutamyl-tRNA(Gln) amidotransferase subunit A|nr:Asp-tRNA(Asn)/Glu-tRNA(Gln) amidotransferase subunit GatA [Flavobacteriales bacterium]MBP9159352.1 Asp-tRNA(Asn)/Glu-tRNA(Gln) amidotransferase subunit GatA [Flavobacteriales bacterium]MCI1751879.1 Asp-tRNA(Asn)/Glu-tRNA(Gln) amidotransferase subunit GatA [Flavobacteriales bacterium]